MRGFSFVASITPFIWHHNTSNATVMKVSSAPQRGSCGSQRKSRVKPSVNDTRKPTSFAHGAFGLIVMLLWTMTLSSYVVDRAILPRYRTSHESSRTVQPNLCGDDDISTDELDDIVVDETDSIQDVKRMVYKHGAAVIPEVLSKQTTSKLRATIQASHEKEQDRDDFFILNQEDRRRRLINVNEDEVYGEALHEIASHDIMRPIIDEIAGPDAALVGLFTITNLPGSDAQPWHSDNQFHMSRRQYPDDYFRVYSIVFALQETTEDMGATAVCPGTQHCKAVSQSAAEEYCIESAPLEAGGALIFDADIFHRGGSHVDMDAPDRVFFFLVLASSETKESSRWLPTRYFQLRWDMFGHTIHDFGNIQQYPWTMWQALGFSFKNVGYSFVSYVLRLLANGMPWRFRFLGKNRAILWTDVEDYWQKSLVISSVATCVWILWWAAHRFAAGTWRGKSKLTSKTL